MLNLTRYDFLLATVVALVGFTWLVMRARKWQRLPYPPGPKRLPVVGNLFSIPSQQGWVTYKKWSEQLGSDIIHVDVMGSHIFVLNSMKVANELLEKRASIYSDRPPLLVLNKLFGMDYNIVFARYGTAWRHSRRIFQAHLGLEELEAYRPLEQQAVHRLLRNLLSSPDNFFQHLRHMAGQVILSIAYGIDVLPENDPYVAGAESVLHAFEIATAKEALLLDLIPWLIKMPSWFPGARYKRYAREWYPIVVGALSTVRNKVESELAAGTATTSVAANLISKLDEDSTEEDLWAARAVPATMYVAGADSTVSSLQTFILAMTLYPEVQRKAQAEMDQVVGNLRLPNFSDQDALPYAQAVLKEVLRWHPVTPLSGQHVVTEDDVYDGYYIPAGSIIIPNAWGMLHDPAVFAEPDRFLPERWLSPDAPAFPNQAFGFGSRQCAGRFLAHASIWSNMVGILAAFNVTPSEEGLPEESYSSGAVSYVKPFRCNILPRSAAAASLVRATEIEG